MTVPPAPTVRRDQPVSLAAKAALLAEPWTPRVVAELNDIQFKVVRIEGDFLWHSHADTDEAFLVLDGVLRIDLRDRQVTVRAGELFVVPRGVEHKPCAEREVRMVLVEPRGVVNTGALVNERTQPNDVWI
jgi:mannose-6-phosphate isomerase-like protein (cupin superfamily)